MDANTACLEMGVPGRSEATDACSSPGNPRAWQ